jgi:hypothetical protein
VRPKGEELADFKTFQELMEREKTRLPKVARGRYLPPYLNDAPE